MESRWDRTCDRCFASLSDTAVHCDRCGQDFVQKHVRITALHKKKALYKDRKQWIGKTGEFIIDTDYKDVEITPIEAGWYGGYFVPDESPSDTWLLGAVKYEEVPSEEVGETEKQEKKGFFGKWGQKHA